MPHKSLAKVSAKRSAKTEDVFRRANAFYKAGVAFERAGKIPQATAAYKKANELMKRASRAGTMAGPVGRLPNGGKKYREQDRIGKAKYTVSYHDGKKKHKDGSAFYDIAIFKNKVKRDAFVRELKQRGFVRNPSDKDDPPIIIRRSREAPARPDFVLLSSIMPKGGKATKIRLPSGQVVSRVQKLPERNSREKVYELSGYTKSGRFVSFQTAAFSKDRALAMARAQMRHITDPRERVTRWNVRISNPGLIDLAANLQAAQSVKDMLAPKRKRHNPSLKATSQLFQGAASGKVSKLKAANSAPADLARIGKLVFIKLAGAKAQTRIPGAMVAVDKNGKLWLCGSRTPMFKRKAKPGEALDYGFIDQVCYATTKKHLDGVPTEYVHAFGEEGGKRPRLLVDHEGMPILRGGDYKITADGIVN